jgi:hypothetical protein
VAESDHMLFRENKPEQYQNMSSSDCNKYQWMTLCFQSSTHLIIFPYMLIIFDTSESFDLRQGFDASEPFGLVAATKSDIIFFK